MNTDYLTSRPSAAFVDDDTLMRAAFATLLPQVQVVAVAAAVDDLVRAIPPGEVVDVVVLDLNLNGVRSRSPVVHGRQAVELLAQQGLRVLIYTNESRPLVLLGCLGAGAQGVIHKAEPISRLTDAIETVSQGGMAVTTAIAGFTEAARSAGLIPNLSPRQVDVLRGRARGESYQSIADRLYITKKTAEDYMSAVTRKFADYLAHHSPADLERELGLGSGDLLA